MKRFIITLCVVVSALTMASAQDENANYTNEPFVKNRPFGISIGYISKQLNVDGDKYSWMSGVDGSSVDDVNKNSSSSYKVGVYWAPEFRYGIGIQTGLYYELSTASYKNEEFDFKTSGSEHTLSIPLRLQYRYEIIPDLSVFLYTGPSFDLSLAYSMKYSYMGAEEKYNFYEQSEVKRFNVLWGVGAGVSWKGLQLMFGRDWGLTNLYNDTSVKSRLNKPFNISLAYLF